MEEGICAGYWENFLSKETTYDAMYYFMNEIKNPQMNNTEEKMGICNCNRNMVFRIGIKVGNKV